MNDRLAGILLSGAIHAACLTLLLFVPAAKGVPIRTFQIRFEQREPFSTKAPRAVTSAKGEKTVAQKRRQEATPNSEGKNAVTPVARENKIDEEVRPLISVAPEPAAVSWPDPGPTVVGAPNPGSTGGAVSGSAASTISGMSSNPGGTAPQKGGDVSITETKFGELDAPTFIHRATPVYPRVARRLEKEGRVVLKLLIDQAGNLRSVEVIEPAPFGFTEAAVEAVRKSTFAPARRNGEGVLSWAVLPIRFRLE